MREQVCLIRPDWAGIRRRERGLDQHSAAARAL